ncbi:hypothetical protein AMS68_005570 [Peltaster fructicola]|uniref:Haloacid dehalogenase-like hydrolase n=1 Tax=Peltaster fructicola TaxID=286661 RepID=A0A6H0XZ69_9PEZI|nr:hypothetical protein AMS68_005570 [Peltaster fructicola]
MARYFRVTLDWDGTLTHKDTMFMMGNIVAQRNARTGQSGLVSQEWKKFGEAYQLDYERHKQSFIPCEAERDNPESECVWLQSLRGVEDGSAKRVEQSGFFKGVIQQDVLRAAEEAVESGTITLRKDWQRLFVEAAAARAGVPLPPKAHIYEIEILSVNWSETMIREVISLHVKRLTSIDEIQRRNLDDLVKHMVIQANDLQGLNTAPGCNGSVTSPNKLAVRTNLDKLKCYARSWDQIHVYVGDSTTDLDCLLAADVGICIRDEPMTSSQSELARALDRVRVYVKHVSDHKHVVEREDGVPAEAKLWWARDFSEVSSFLTRISVLRA